MLTAPGRPVAYLTVQLSEIGARKQAQPFGMRSRQYLAVTCFERAAMAATVAAKNGLDRFGRTVARVTCAAAM